MMHEKPWKTVISFLIAGLVWKLASLTTNSLILPPPERVINTLAGLIISPDTWKTTAGTAARALAGLAAALLSGTFCAMVLAPLTPYLRPSVTLIQNIPLVSWTLLAVIWFGFNDSSVSFVVFTATFPVIYLNTLSGLTGINAHLREIAINFRLPPVLRWYGIELASVGTHLSAGVSVAIAIMWKSAVMAELFSSVRGIGFSMEISRTYLQTDRLMAWTLLLVSLGMLSDFAWRLIAKSGAATIIYRSGLRFLPLFYRAVDETASAGRPLRVMGLSKEYVQEGKHIPVLDNISLELKPGETALLTGLSGTGKTTLLRALAGLESTDGGSVSRQGKKICMMFQEPRLLPWFTAEENIVLVLLRNTTYKAALAKAREMLGILGIPGKCHPHQLSGGMQKAVSLARTLAVHCDVLLLDEPFSSSDPEQQKRMLRLIAMETGDGCITLIAAHHAESIYNFRKKFHLEGSPAVLSQSQAPGDRNNRITVLK